MQYSRSRPRNLRFHRDNHFLKTRYLYDYQELGTAEVATFFINAAAEKLGRWDTIMSPPDTSTTVPVWTALINAVFKYSETPRPKRSNFPKTFLRIPSVLDRTQSIHGTSLRDAAASVWMLERLIGQCQPNVPELGTFTTVVFLFAVLSLYVKLLSKTEKLRTRISTFVARSNKV